MAATIACPKCHAVHTLPDQAFGHRVRCVTCNHSWRVRDLPPLAIAEPMAPPVPPRSAVAHRRRRIQWSLWLPVVCVVLVPGTLAAIVALRIAREAPTPTPRSTINFREALNASPSKRIKLLQQWIAIDFGSRLVKVSATDESGEANAFVIEWHLVPPLFDTATEEVAGRDALRIIRLVRASGAPCENLILWGRHDDRGPRRIVLIRRFSRETLEATDWGNVDEDRVFWYAANRS